MLIASRFRVTKMTGSNIEDVIVSSSRKRQMVTSASSVRAAKSRWRVVNVMYHAEHAWGLRYCRTRGAVMGDREGRGNAVEPV